MNAIAERRRIPRSAQMTEAWADPGGASAPIDCRIADINEIGAKIVVAAGVNLPDKFELFIDANAHLGQVEVIWRTGAHVGVKFTDPA